jgi:hypothetical protein
MRLVTSIAAAAMAVVAVAAQTRPAAAAYQAFGDHGRAQEQDHAAPVAAKD